MGMRMKHTLPDLPYDYNALEPYISADIMKLHHTKHHQTYVNNLNIAEEKLAEAMEKSKWMIRFQLLNIFSRQIYKYQITFVFLENKLFPQDI